MGLKPSEALRDLMVAFARLELRHGILTGEEPLTRDLTVAGYMALADQGRAKVWEKWYREVRNYRDIADVAVKKIAHSDR
jgi:hypothetical protein